MGCSTYSTGATNLGTVHNAMRCINCNYLSVYLVSMAMKNKALVAIKIRSVNLSSHCPNLIK